MLSSLPVVGAYFAEEPNKVHYKSNEDKSHLVLKEGDKAILVTIKEVSSEKLKNKGLNLEEMHKMPVSTSLKDVVNMVMPKGEAEEKVEKAVEEPLKTERPAS